MLRSPTFSTSEFFCFAKLPCTTRTHKPAERTTVKIDFSLPRMPEPPGYIESNLHQRVAWVITRVGFLYKFIQLTSSGGSCRRARYRLGWKLCLRQRPVVWIVRHEGLSS